MTTDYTLVMVGSFKIITDYTLVMVTSFNIIIDHTVIMHFNIVIEIIDNFSLQLFKIPKLASLNLRVHGVLGKHNCQTSTSDSLRSIGLM